MYEPQEITTSATMNVALTDAPVNGTTFSNITSGSLTYQPPTNLPGHMRLEIRNLAAIEMEDNRLADPDQVVRLSRNALNAMNTPSVAEDSTPEQL